MVAPCYHNNGDKMNDKTELLIFCENVKRLRKIHKLSKKEMAKKLGIEVKSLSLIESGTLPPRLSCKVLFRICYYFKVKPKDMFIPFPTQ